MQILEFISPIMLHTTLNPQLWNGDQVREPVRLKLLAHAREFIKSWDLDQVPLRDIVLTGSMTNLTYTPASDLDLHIIVDMDKIYGGGSLVENFLDAKRRLWNKTYDVELYGTPVEVYVEDDDETVRGNKYSLISNEWLVREPLKDTQYDDRSVRAKYGYLTRHLTRILDRADSVDDLDRVMRKLKQYRQSGLDQHGEFSTENLVFKALRNNGWLERIQELRVTLTNKSLSLD
jgi:hypothetical protein